MRSPRVLRVQFWLEIGLAVATASLALLTVLTAEWIEVVFGLDPDGGSGRLEWGVVGALAVAAAGFALLARGSWARISSTP